MNEIKEQEEPANSKANGKVKNKALKQKDRMVLFRREDASRWLPFTLFLFVMVVAYISVQQYAEKLVRNTEKLNREIKDLRSEFLSTKAELMQESMQTDIAKKLEGTGLK